MGNKEYEYCRNIDLNIVNEKLGVRNPDGHKGTFGTLLCICGSYGMPGAAIMSINAALRCGVGLIKAAIPKSIYEIVARRIEEAVFIPLPENEEKTISFNADAIINDNIHKCTAILIGCGLGRSRDLDKVIYNIVGNSGVPIIIDADGINAISENIDVLGKTKSRIIITPHLGEMSRLIHTSVEEILPRRFKYVRDFSKRYGVITVLKGSETVISDENGGLFINRMPNSGMAKGGSGDVLSGIIGSFLAQGLEPINSALCGVYLHGLCGERCRKNLSETAMLPSDVIQELPNIFLEIGR